MKKNLFFFLFLLFIFSFILFFYSKKEDITKKTLSFKEVKKEIKEDKDNVIWYFGQDKIEFHYKYPPKGQENYTLIWAVEKKDFPDLFYRLDYNLIHITPYAVKDKTLYALSNIFYQAAGYTLYYGMIVDLPNKKVLYQTPEVVKKGTFSSWLFLENGDIKIYTLYPHYDYCRSCAFSFVDYIRYENGKFVSVNHLYKDEFKKIYKDFEENNGCYVIPGEKKMSFEQIKNQFGENYQCRSSQKDIDFLGATPKEYFYFKERIEKILKYISN